MLCVEDLQLRINGREVLQGIQLHLQPGDIYGLLGPNGAGKSTTIFALLGLRARSGGTINLFSHDPMDHALDIRRLVGVMPEQAGFYGWMSALMYLRWFARFFERLTTDQELERLLDKVGLREVIHSPIGSYSRGMKQRLAIARALVSRPKLLILDEPTNGLDPKGRREVHDLLLEFAADRKAGVLLCTHLLDDVDRLCSHIGIVHKGQTRAEGRLSDLLNQNLAGPQYRLRIESGPQPPNLPDGISLISNQNGWLRVKLRSGIKGEPSAMWAEMLRRGWRIEEIRSEAAGLEEFYLKLTSEPQSIRKAKPQ